jgi:hypothetical protein
MSFGLPNVIGAPSAKRVRVVNRNYDIPYIAGYSQDGRTVFIDRHLPQTFRWLMKTVRVEPFLVTHEIVEKALLDELRLQYLHAHQIALRIERNAVKAAGVSWRVYQTIREAARKGDRARTVDPRSGHARPDTLSRRARFRRAQPACAEGARPSTTQRLIWPALARFLWYRETGAPAAQFVSKTTADLGSFAVALERLRGLVN